KTSDGRLDPEYLEEISNHFHPGCRDRFASASQPEIFGSGKGLVACHILIDTALASELFIGIGGVGCTGPSAFGWWRCDPHEFVGMREGKRPQKDGVDHAEGRHVGSNRKR